MNKSSILMGFEELLREPENPAIRQARDSGKQILGYFCTYMPVELITAAGLVPLRLRGKAGGDTALADAYMSSRICTYVRHTVNLAIDGQLDFLAGEISLNTCDHVRRAYDVLRHKTSLGFHGFLSVPRQARESLLDWYVEELQNLSKALEDHFKVKIYKKSLRAAIVKHNEVRRLLAELNRHRSGPDPRLTGAEMLLIQVVSLITPPDYFIGQARALLKALVKAKPLAPARARLLLYGGELDEPAYVRHIESQGALVAGDRLCFGQRVYDELIPSKGDPLTTLARAYMMRIPCARMIGDFAIRAKDIIDTVKAIDADGVVFQRLTFCDPWAGEAHNLKNRLKKEGIPILILEREYGTSQAGQVKTRVQAFIEQISAQKARQTGGAGAQGSRP